MSRDPIIKFALEVTLTMIDCWAALCAVLLGLYAFTQIMG